MPRPFVQHHCPRILDLDEVRARRTPHHASRPVDPSLRPVAVVGLVCFLSAAMLLMAAAHKLALWLAR